MGRVSDILIPSRFLLTVGHFVVTILAFYQKDLNVKAGLVSSTVSTSDFQAGTSSLSAALVLTLVCLAVEFVGLFGGFTMFFNRLNFCHMVLHFFGGTLTAWYLLDVWGYKSYWWIWGVFSLIPAVMEACAFAAIFWLKIYRY